MNDLDNYEYSEYILNNIQIQTKVNKITFKSIIPRNLNELILQFLIYLDNLKIIF